MANYKGLTFSNTTEGFKRWSKEFPPLEKPVKTGYKKHDDYYLELQLVKGFLGSSPFVSTSVRQYDPEDKDFRVVDNATEKELLNTVFSSKVENFKNKWL